MVHIPVFQKKEEKRVIGGQSFEFETYMPKAELARFLRGLAEQIEKGDELSLSSDDWKMNFKFNEPVELEVEFDAQDKKLEIEIEFRQTAGISAP